SIRTRGMRRVVDLFERGEVMPAGGTCQDGGRHVLGFFSAFFFAARASACAMIPSGSSLNASPQPVQQNQYVLPLYVVLVVPLPRVRMHSGPPTPSSASVVPSRV